MCERSESLFQSYCTFLFSFTVASFPNSNFTMSALERLEAVSGISVYKQLASKLPTMVSTLYTDTRDMFQEWISDVRPPTWQTLLVKLLGIDDLLAKAIEDFLHPKTQTASQVPNYCCCLPIAMVRLLLLYNCCCLPIAMV